MMNPPSSVSIFENPKDVLSTCEIAEISGNDDIPYSPVTHLAVLLYLGYYSQARYLWRRWKSSSLAVSGGEIWQQFSQLWSIGQSMILLDSANVYQKLTILEQQQQQSTTTTTTTVVPSLQQMAPELKQSYRQQMLQLMERTYDVIGNDDCAMRLGFLDNSSSSSSSSMEQFLIQRFWKRAEHNPNYWIPAIPEKKNPMDNNNTNTNLENDIHKNKIHTLTEMITFLEEKRLNA